MRIHPGVLGATTSGEMVGPMLRWSLASFSAGALSSVTSVVWRGVYTG